MTIKAILMHVISARYLLTFIFYQSFSFIGMIGVSLAFWIISNNVIMWFKKKDKLSIGMVVSHLGIGFLILGITGSSVWQQEKIIKMNLKNEVKIQNYNIVFKEIVEIKGSNYLALRGNFFVYNDKKKLKAPKKVKNLTRVSICFQKICLQLMIKKMVPKNLFY